LELSALNLSSGVPSICSLFGEVSIKGLLGVIGSKKSGHGWPVDVSPSRGFRFILVSIWERTFLEELCSNWGWPNTVGSKCHILLFIRWFIYSNIQVFKALKRSIYSYKEQNATNIITIISMSDSDIPGK